MSRASAIEQLDDLSLDGEVLRRTLSELGWINRRLGVASRIARAVQALNLPENPVIVDLGCGGGDVLQAISSQLPSSRLVGIDGNPATLEFAASQVDATFLVADILAEEFEVPECDVLVSTHFLYHLADDRLVPFLRRAQSRVRVGIVLGELQRSELAARLFGWFGSLAGLSSMTLSDGQLAVRRAFTFEELDTLLAPLGATLRPWGFSMVGTLPGKGPVE